MTTQAQLPQQNDFRKSINGKSTDLFYLKNAHGMAAAITNYGGRLISLLVPSRSGELIDVVVGMGTLQAFLDTPEEAYYGATVGRYANRIANGRFSLDGKEYVLAVNNGPNHLHGGIKGFQAVVWDAEQLDDSSLLLSYRSIDGEEGYPGNLDVELTYSLTENNELTISFKAATDKTTVINLTNHTYYNLNGVGSGTIENHVLQINADYYTPTDQYSVPTGVLEPVSGSPFDFRKPFRIGERINEDYLQLEYGSGYDHNFVLNKTAEEKLSFAASATGDKTGVLMEVFTEEPGIQLYTGNFMKGENALKGGSKDERRNAFCLETQHFPDSPNRASFPSTILQPEEVYQSNTLLRFTS